MACNVPLVAWKSTSKTALGKRAVTFKMGNSYLDLPLNLPCGQCYGCRNDKARMWAIRCSHEAQLYDQNSFLTLTYEKEPKTKSGYPTLRKRDFQLFMKRLRKARECKCKPPCQINHKIKYFMCGEYGELEHRPHYHALCFNLGFADMYYWRKKGDHNLYRSPELEELWKEGHSEIGSVTFESAAYVAGYTLEGTTGTHGNTAESKRNNYLGIVSEYLTMSRRPGIGKDWLKKYMSDVYPMDEVITKAGNKLRPPRYYDQQLEKENPKLLEQLQLQRRKKLTPEQLSGALRSAKEKILRAKSKLRSRTL